MSSNLLFHHCLYSAGVVHDCRRHPSPVHRTNCIAETLTLLQKKKRSIYIAGDFNFDLLKINEKLHYSTFLENIISAGFYPKISLPTRYNRNTGSATLIDNIFTNHIDNSTSGVFTNEISDHQMIYTYSNESFLNNNPAKYIDIESNTNEKLDNFLIELQNIDLTNKLDQNPFTNPSKNYDTFINILTNIKQRVLPKTRVKFNKKKHKKSQWMSRGILNSINSKDKLYKKTGENISRFSNLCNFKN